MASCGTITVLAEDESELSLSKSLQSDEPEQITVDYTVSNQTVSGDGETLSADVEIELNGDAVETHGVSLEPGETDSGTYVIEGVGEGEHEVCVRLD